MNPKISVIMSVYNGEAHLKQSIDSILNQTFTDFEFVIIDDASTDKTAEILKGYSFKDPRIKVITNASNLGLTKSLNIGIKSARAEYIARIDAGDTSEKERLEKEVRFLDENPAYILVGTWARFVNESGELVGGMKCAVKDAEIKSNLIKHNQFVHSSIMVRKSAFEEVGFYNESWKYAQDHELYFRLARVGKMANLSEYLVYYLVYPGSITRKKNKKQILFAVRARSEAIKRGQYGFWNYIYLLLPLLGVVLPYKMKEAIKKI